MGQLSAQFVGRRVSPISKLDRIIAGTLKGAPVFCQIFDQVLWRDREETLSELGFNAIPRRHLHEVSKPEAEQHLTNALAFDLCYGVKLFSKSDAAAIASDFTSRLHWQARYFINTPEPLVGRFTGAYAALSDEATIDTGVMAKSGDWFGGLLWVFSSD